MTPKSTVLLLRAESKAKEINEQPNRWAYAEYRSLPFNPHPLCHVRLHHGTKLSDGSHEREIGWEDFYDDGTSRRFVHNG